MLEQKREGISTVRDNLRLIMLKSWIKQSRLYWIFLIESLRKNIEQINYKNNHEFSMNKKIRVVNKLSNAKENNISKKNLVFSN